MSDSPVFVVDVMHDGSTYIGKHLLSHPSAAAQLSAGRALDVRGVRHDVAIHFRSRGELTRAVMLGVLVKQAGEALQPRRPARQEAAA